MKKMLTGILVVLLALAGSGCGTGVTPQAGDWEGAISFDLSTGTDVVMVSFTVSEDGQKIESWSMFDAATGSISFGQETEIKNGRFVLESKDYGSGLNITRHFEGTFTAADKMEGQCELSYGNYGSYTGTWEAAPKTAQP